MFRSSIRFFCQARLCQLVIRTQPVRTLHRHCLFNQARPLLLNCNTTPQFRSNSRAMATADKRDLAYEDIVELAQKKKELAEKKIVLIDVREPDEIKETGLIPGFVHIPLGEVPAALTASEESFKQKYGVDKPSEEANLVFSCRSGKRSAQALKTALERGYTNSQHYAGGWLDWESKTKK